MRWHRTSLDSHHSRPATDRDPTLEDDEVDEQALARLTESFHSELGPSSARRKHVSWSKERRSGSLGRSRQSIVSAEANRLRQSLHMTSPTIPPPEDVDFVRGRPAQRPSVDEPTSPSTWSSQRRNSRASRKGAGMVFLGVWALFGIGTLAGSGRGLPTGSAVRIGKVFTREEHAVPAFVDTIPTAVSDLPLKAHVPSPIDIHQLLSSHENDGHHEPPHDPDEPSAPSTEYIIGRISAWICTTMYLTSRLPQIWKNVSSFQTFAWIQSTEFFLLVR